MTKFSKVLLVLLVCASAAFFGLAAMSATSYSNVQSRLEKAKAEKKIRTDKLAALQALTPPVADVEAKTNDVRKWNPADRAAMDARAELMAKQLVALNAEYVLLSQKTIEKHQETKLVREEVERLRAETTQLLAQLDSLRSERGAAEAEEKRLKDLLVQAEGMLQRAEQRNDQLKADGAAN